MSLFAATMRDDRFAQGRAFAARWLAYRTATGCAPFDPDLSVMAVSADDPETLAANVRPRTDFLRTPKLFDALAPPGDGRIPVVVFVGCTYDTSTIEPPNWRRCLEFTRGFLGTLAPPNGEHPASKVVIVSPPRDDVLDAASFQARLEAYLTTEDDPAGRIALAQFVRANAPGAIRLVFHLAPGLSYVVRATYRAVESALGSSCGVRCEAVTATAQRCGLEADGHEIHSAKGKRWVGSGNGAREVPSARKSAPRRRKQ